jgi:hypothetical protein
MGDTDQGMSDLFYHANPAEGYEHCRGLAIPSSAEQPWKLVLGTVEDVLKRSRDGCNLCTISRITLDLSRYEQTNDTIR